MNSSSRCSIEELCLRTVMSRLCVVSSGLRVVRVSLTLCSPANSANIELFTDMRMLNSRLIRVLRQFSLCGLGRLSIVTVSTPWLQLQLEGSDIL